MYARRLTCRNQKLKFFCQPSKSVYRLIYRDSFSSQPFSHAAYGGNYTSNNNPIQRNLLDFFPNWIVGPGNSQIGFYRWPSLGRISCDLQFYSSEGDGSNTSRDKQTPVNDESNFHNGKNNPNMPRQGAWHFDDHLRLGEQDQKEWLDSEKISMESKRKESPFLSRREKFKNEFLRRIIPWEKLIVTWEKFPYHIHEGTKNLLVECASSHIKHRKLAKTFGCGLTSSSGRILLQSVPGTELYRERLVRALARDLQVPLLVLDSSILAPYDFGEDCYSESESDDNTPELGGECTSESGFDDDNDLGNDEGEWTSGDEAKSEDSNEDEVDVRSSAEALKKIVPFNIDEIDKNERLSRQAENSPDSSKSETVETSDTAKQLLRKGDRVRYIGPTLFNDAVNRSLTCGQLGEVYEVEGDRVALILDFTDNKAKNTEDDKLMNDKAKNVEGDKITDPSLDPAVIWINAKDIDLDFDSESEDFYIAMEALCEVLRSTQPLIVYFADSSQWLARAVPKSERKEFVHRVEEMFDQLSGPVVLICGQNKSGSESKEKTSEMLSNFGRLAKLPYPLKRLTEGLKASKKSEDNDIYKLFNNVLCIYPPKEEDLLRTFNKQVEEDRRIVIARSNITEIHKVLEEHDLICLDLLLVNTDDVILTKQKAEMIVGWAKNHYLSSCTVPSIKGGRLQIPRQSLETAILRLKEQETISKKLSQDLKGIAKDEYESNFISAVVPPGEIGVKFDDIGALEEIKTSLNELVILPMKRPELFSHGNLLRPCKGILLFGPPGTGKTLLAKALATEAGANFISITGSTLTSKWFGDAEKLTKALFSFASKLAPVIIFVDEVDSLLGARGSSFEHEATRRMRNEFMAAWDGLRTKDSQRILILGATNRPFDLDDAVIRRLPRRVYVELPDAKNRMKILKIFLAQENLEPNFEYDKLANATEGYSGSDLKNLCIAAAYKPVQELLEKERSDPDCKSDLTPGLRQLNLDDFIQSKAKVGPSLAYDATSMNELRKWNEQYGEGGSRKKSPFGFEN